ncbi:MAG: MarR family transcriptional regulator [Spirochaetales bacterium]|nr:MarR family transcriptional regulator [Spirochaetales bacterium]
MSAPQSAVEGVFRLARLWERLFDQHFQPDGFGVKSFLLMAAMDHKELEAPTLGEMASILAMSHQNVRKLANRLEQSGYLLLQKDPHDRRILRIHRTKKYHVYWTQQREKDAQAFQALFTKLNPRELRHFADLAQHLALRAEEELMKETKQ